MSEDMKSSILNDSPGRGTDGENTDVIDNNNAEADMPGGAEANPAGDGSLADINDVETLKSMLTQEKNRAEDLFGKLARMQADFENYKRRSARDREDIYKYASEGLILQLLPVLDNLERALAAKGQAPAKVIEGVEMIYKQFGEVLEREGLTPVPSVGEIFDPSKHEAVMQEDGCDLPDNTVSTELRKGYCLKGKVIRPAMVKVANS